MIFLDEPTTGLDPPSRRTMWESIRELVASGVTILLTTQYLDEADELADQVAVLDGGRIVAEGTPASSRRRIPGGHVELQFATTGRAPRRSAAARRPPAPTSTSSCSRCPTTPASPRCGGLFERLDDAHIDVEHLSVHTPDLDDVFFAVTGPPRPREDDPSP